MRDLGFLLPVFLVMLFCAPSILIAELIRRVRLFLQLRGGRGAKNRSCVGL